MQFDNSFFENEVRDGFFIPGMVKRSWAVQMEVLEAVADICKRHNLKWYADYGTLMGAIRHGGYIPWDDDLDICMFRDDYEKFHQFAKEELPSDLVMLCIEDNVEYDNFLIRVTKGHFISTDSDFLMKNHGLPYCAGIDIFPLDYIYRDKDKEKERVEKVVKIQDMANKIYVDSLSKSQKKEIITRMEAISGKKVDKSIPLTAAHIRLIVDLIKEASREEADCAAMMHFYVNGGGQIRPLEWYEHSIEVKFENGTICVPARYDEVLKLEYGNWGVANRRGGLHDYPFFLEQEGTLMKQNGSLPYRFDYTTEIENVSKTRLSHYLSCNQYANMLHTMGKVHEMIGNLMEKNVYQDAMNLCSKSQEFAMTVGTAVEEQFGEGTSLVTALEGYCEEVFHMFEAISQGEQNKALETNARLAELVNDMEKTYHDEFRTNKSVLFVPVKEEDWKWLEALYRSEVDQGNVQAFVMPLPFYERENDGNIGEAHWEFDRFPKELQLLDYKTVNLNTTHFERIYMTSPYDEYQSGMTVDTTFYSNVLSIISDQLILVQNVNITNPLDEKTMENLKQYVLTPGVKRADYVMVSNPEMKQAFEKILGDVRASKEIVVDANIGAKPSVKKKEKGQKKNIVFWSGIADHYARPTKIIDWIDNRIDIFASNKDNICVYWVLPDSLETGFFTDYSSIRQHYEKLIEKFNAIGLGKVITEAEAEKMLDEFDAFYGSSGFLLNKSALRKIPAMISNIDI